MNHPTSPQIALREALPHESPRAHLLRPQPAGELPPPRRGNFGPITRRPVKGGDWYGYDLVPWEPDFGPNNMPAFRLLRSWRAIGLLDDSMLTITPRGKRGTRISQVKLEEIVFDRVRAYEAETKSKL